MPAASAASSISPDSRVSRTIRTCGCSAGSVSVAARPRFMATSAVRNSPATPRTPSVPNRAMRPLALRELRPLAGLLQAGLLALLLTRVAREVTAALHLAAERGVGLHQRARDAVPQGVRLSGHSAAV